MILLNILLAIVGSIFAVIVTPSMDDTKPCIYIAAAFDISYAFFMTELSLFIFGSFLFNTVLFGFFLELITVSVWTLRYALCARSVSKEVDLAKINAKIINSPYYKDASKEVDNLITPSKINLEKDK